jgi:hypothetical protein
VPRDMAGAKAIRAAYREAAAPALGMAKWLAH